MSLRKNLSPDQKMAIIVASWGLVMAATVGTLYYLTPPKPDPVPVTPQTVGPDAPPIGDAPATDAPAMAPPATRQERVFTVPGGAQPAPGVVPAPTPQTFTAPGVQPPGMTQPGMPQMGQMGAPPQGISQQGAPPNMQPQNGPPRGPQNPPRIASNPDFRPGGRSMPMAPRGNGGQMPMLPSPPSMGGGNRPSMPNGPTPRVNVPAQRAFEAGQAALRAGDKNKAATEFAKVVRLAPDDVPSRLGLAGLYLDLKQPARAVPHLREVVKRDPNNAAVQFTLARALLADRKLDEAVPYLRKTVQLAPQERQAKVILAQVLFDTKKPAEAYQQWSALAQSNPKDIEAQMQAAALANDVLKQPAQAEKWLRRAVAAAPPRAATGFDVGAGFAGAQRCQRRGTGVKQSRAEQSQRFRGLPATRRRAHGGGRYQRRGECAAKRD